MNYYEETFLGLMWFLAGMLSLYLGWVGQSTSTPFEISLRVNMGVLGVLGGLVLIFHAYGFGQGD